MPTLHIHLKVKIVGKLGPDRLLEVADVAADAVIGHDDPNLDIRDVQRTWHLETP